MPDFFSLSVFQVVLRNPAIAHQLLKFGQTRLAGEHMEFLAKVNSYHVLLHEVSRSISGIYEEFFADGAPKYVNVPQVSVNHMPHDFRLLDDREYLIGKTQSMRQRPPKKKPLTHGKFT